MVKKKQMEKFVSIQYFLVQFIYILFLSSIMVSGSYYILKGKKLVSFIEDIFALSLIFGLILFGFFMSFIFPRKYPEEFEEYYRKPVKTTPEGKKSMTTLKRILIAFTLLISFFVFDLFYTIYTSGFREINSIYMPTLVLSTFFLGIIGLYFIHLLEK